MYFLPKILLTIILTVSLTQVSNAGGVIDGIFPEQKVRFIQCYPNPATTSINFETSNLIEKNNLVLTIYNFIGKKVDEVKINSNKVTISLENYFRGLYVYQLKDKQGQLIESGKFQVTK